MTARIIEDKIEYRMSPEGALHRLRWLTPGQVDQQYALATEGPWQTHIAITLPEREEMSFPLQSRQDDQNGASEKVGPFRAGLTYAAGERSLCVEVTITNESEEPQTCCRLRLFPGIDTFMREYPAYMGKCFPTTLQYERTHFWGMLGAPDGRWLAIASPDAIDSFALMYDEHGGHSIHTFALDLVNAIDPRPSRYAPPDPVFAPMSSRRWRLHFIPLSNEDELGPAVAQFAEAPFLTWQTSGGLPGETLVCDVYSPTASKPEWEAGPAAIRQISSALHDAVSHTVYSITLPPAQLPGTYLPLRLCTGSRQISPQAYVRGQWERYIHTASAHALSTRPPVATYVIEAAMPAFSLLAAERLSPSPTRRASIEGFLRDSLFSAAFSPDGEQLMLPSRIQNQTTSVDFCREMYLGCNDKYWLEMAEKTAVRFLETQADDGAYRTRDEGNHYTCVYYPAKSLMDLAIVERQVATACNDLGERARHSELATRLLDSAGMAMDDLLRRGVDVGTEGAPTYEDGAISCASLQMTLWSLMTGDRRFADMGQEMMQGHRCVEWRGADARTHGATIRFWESFWAIGMANFLNTPHGWSAWTAYAWYYLYLATGDVTHYHRFHNTLMTCLSLIDIAIGGVHFCYTPESTVYDGAGRALAGESTFHLVRPNEGGQGGGESHEVIKLVMDTVLSTAFLLYGEAGWEGLNVAIKNESGKTRVQPASPRISRLYVNYAGADPKALPELDGWNANAIIVLPCTDPIAFFSTV